MTEFPETRSALLVEVRSPENREAWEQFVLVYRPVIYRMARRRGMQDADAQDVAQNILVRVAGAIDRWEQQPGTRFRHWLRRVARGEECDFDGVVTVSAGCGGGRLWCAGSSF